VCHRDLSLENILVNQDRKSVIIDLGVCLRVPYSSEAGSSVGDVSTGNLRRLIQPLVPCGKKTYISPEIMRSEAPFDGFAVDLWAAAVILFIMLVGVPPWDFPGEEDPRYRAIVLHGGLARMLYDWSRPISPLAADLLQHMFQEDPRHRLSLAQVRGHDWVCATEEEEEHPMRATAAVPTNDPPSVNGPAEDLLAEAMPSAAVKEELVLLEAVLSAAVPEKSDLPEAVPSEPNPVSDLSLAESEASVLPEAVSLEAVPQVAMPSMAGSSAVGSPTAAPLEESDLPEAVLPDAVPLGADPPEAIPPEAVPSSAMPPVAVPEDAMVDMLAAAISASSVPTEAMPEATVSEVSKIMSVRCDNKAARVKNGVRIHSDSENGHSSTCNPHLCSRQSLLINNSYQSLGPLVIGLCALLDASDIDDCHKKVQRYGAIISEWIIKEQQERYQHKTDQQSTG